MKIAAAALLALLVVLPEAAAFAQPVPPADVGGAQGQPRRGGFLEMLFGPSLLRPFRPDNAPGNGFIPPPQPGPPVPSEPPVPTVQILEKDKNAKKILVIGDFVAGGLAWGLDQTFAEEPKLAILDRSQTNSGLVRTDFFDWNAELPRILNEDKPDIVVVAMGANDRQQMRIGRDRIAPHSETWETTYQQRLKGLTDTLKVYGRPFFWVSAPPMRLAAAARDMTYLNGFYTDAVEEAGGHFIDIWNGFTSDEGNYISSGPDVDGQLRALRASDGINFTRAGRLKLAFYVEREIRRQTGIGAGAVDLLASTSQANQIEVGPDGQKRLVGPVLSLTDPRPGSDALAGAPDPVPEVQKESETPQYMMIVKGAALPTVAGRADDFTWPPPTVSPPGPTAAAN
ncbi:MAG TPA: SGNH family hydrolase [Bauldia sp.]|nr:SGNH family hydrolase [Bauldia sp.]